MTESILTTQTPASIGTDTNQPRVLGMDFTTAAATLAVGVRFYATPTNLPDSVIGLLWDKNSLTELARCTIVPATANNWNSGLFGAPVSLTIGTVYTVGYWFTGETANYSFTSGGLSSDIVNGNLTALANSGRFQNNISPAQYPNNTAPAFLFFADILVDFGSIDISDFEVLTFTETESIGLSDSEPLAITEVASTGLSDTEVASFTETESIELTDLDIWTFVDGGAINATLSGTETLSITDAESLNTGVAPTPDIVFISGPVTITAITNTPIITVRT